MQTFGSSLSCWHSPGYKSCCAANNIADLHVCEIREPIVSPCMHTCVHILFLRAAFHRSTNSISVGPSSIDSLGFNHLKHISACHCFKIVHILFFSKKTVVFRPKTCIEKHFRMRKMFSYIPWSHAETETHAHLIEKTGNAFLLLYDMNASFV